MSDLKDKVVDATKKVLDAGDKLTHDLKTNHNDAKEKIDALNDKAKGKFNQVKGGVKVEIGKLTDNNKLQAEGMVDKVVGKAQEIKGNVKDTVIDIKKKLTK
jgi:uncharacterized protein YjbJ (UPF0337 family)